MIAAFSFVSLQALSYDEMLEQEYIEPIGIECDSELGYLCFSTPRLPVSQQISAIRHNFYSSYYHIVLDGLDAEDKKEFEKINKKMPEDRRVRLQEASEYTLSEGENPVHYDMYVADTLYEVYMEYIGKITNFIYDNPKYKYIFDEIFAPNPKEYYELINKNSIFLLDKIFEKAAKDNLIDKTGKLIQK